MVVSEVGIHYLAWQTMRSIPGFCLVLSVTGVVGSKWPSRAAFDHLPSRLQLKKQVIVKSTIVCAPVFHVTRSEEFSKLSKISFREISASSD